LKDWLADRFQRDDVVEDAMDPDTARAYHDESLPADGPKVAHFCLQPLGRSFTKGVHVPETVRPLHAARM